MKKYVNTNFKKFIQDRLNEKGKVSILPSTKPKRDDEELEDPDEEPIEDNEEDKDDSDEVDEMIKEYNKLYFIVISSIIII